AAHGGIRGRCPRNGSFSASSLALVLGCPSSAVSSPVRAGVVRRQSIVFPLRPAFFRRPTPSHRLRCGAAKKCGTFGPHRPTIYASVGPEALFVESDLLGQHVIDRPAELGGQHPQGLGLAALLLLPLHPLLGSLAAAEKQTRRLREGPT